MKFTSYRCEARGMICALVFYDKAQILTAHCRGQRDKANVTIFCDNKALVKVVNKWRNQPITPKVIFSPEANIVHEIMIYLCYIGKLGENIWIRHVKGHQDRTSLNLSFAATL
jgi:hypothetical protein